MLKVAPTFRIIANKCGNLPALLITTKGNDLFAC